LALNREEIFFATRSELRKWLGINFANTEGIWAVHYKKSSGLGDLSWDAIVEECLCFGWIDSLPGKVDETKTKIYISPRKPNSGWSRRNKDLLIELQKSDLIQKPGIDAIERAKANGSWERFDMAEALEISSELQLVFDEDPKFFSKWKALSEAKQRQALQLIYDAKTQATMQNRIQDLRQSLS
jgi:uncharacterized protein YdeI (YjbR/CyaY-like superfamily)